MTSFNSSKVLQTLTRRVVFGVSSLAALSVGFVSCKGDETSLACGAGTSQKGDVCVALADNLGGAGGEGGAPAQSSFEFDGVTAVAPISTSSLLVVWGPAEDSDATFNVYVAKKVDGFNFSAPQATAPAGARSVQLTGLDEDTKYFVTVRAELDGEEDGNTVSLSATTGDDVEPPNFAGATKAESNTASAVKLSWSKAADELTPSEAMQYVVYFGDKSGDVDLETPFAVSAPGATSIVVTGLPLADTEYYFVVRALDAAGNQDDNEIEVSAKSGPDTSAPTFGGCTAALPKTATAIEVFWEPAKDGVAAPEQISYNIYASKTPDGHNFSEPGATITGDVAKGVISGLAANTTYYVVCRAADPSGNEDENVVTRSAKTKSDDQPPAFAGITSIANVTSKGFDVVWGAASDNQTAEENIVYDVFLAAATGEQEFELDPAITTAPGATGVTITTLDSNTQYFVVVRARDEADNFSDNTEELSEKTLVSLRNDIELPIFLSKCATNSGCHATSGAAHSMRLDPGWSYASIVNVDAKSARGTGMKRVVPEDPDASHLYQRVTYPDNDPDKMPPTDDPVDTEIIRLWIEQGALNN